MVILCAVRVFVGWVLVGLGLYGAVSLFGLVALLVVALVILGALWGLRAHPAVEVCAVLGLYALEPLVIVVSASCALWAWRVMPYDQLAGVVGVALWAVWGGEVVLAF